MRPYTRCPAPGRPWASGPCADLWARCPSPAYDAVMAPAATPRIEPLPREEWDDVLTRVLEGSSGGTEEPMHIFTTLARAPGDLFRRWLGFGGALLGGTLPGSSARDRHSAHGVPLRRALRVGPAHRAGRAGRGLARGDHRARRRSGREWTGRRSSGPPSTPSTRRRIRAPSPTPPGRSWPPA